MTNIVLQTAAAEAPLAAMTLLALIKAAAVNEKHRWGVFPLCATSSSSSDK